MKNIDKLQNVEDKTLRIYTLIRMDIGMSCGKMCSQSSHAAIGAFVKTSPEIQKAYQGDDGIGTKVCLKAKNLQAIERVESELISANIPYYKVIDSGCANFFNGEPIVTALGISPVTKQQIQHITKRFQLL